MIEPTDEQVLSEMLDEARKELFSLKISRRIKEKLILRLITPATEQLRMKMEKQIAEYDVLISSQEKGVEILREFIADAQKNAKDTDHNNGNKSK